MKVLDSNPKLLLVSNKTTTYILNKPNLTIFGQGRRPGPTPGPISGSLR